METESATPDVVASLSAAAGVASAAPGDPRVTADPIRVDRTDVRTVRGRGLPVIEFCSRTVRIFVVSAQNSAPIAQRHVSDRGHFSFRWIPKNKNIGPGRWRRRRAHALRERRGRLDRLRAGEHADTRPALVRAPRNNGAGLDQGGNACGSG